MSRCRWPISRRITAIHLPGFAIERWLRTRERQGEAPPDDLPVALAVDGPHGPVVHALNRAARLAGVTRGKKVSTQACPDCGAGKEDFEMVEL